MKNSAEIGLYVHIPFCDHICGYCDFFTVYRKSQSSAFRRFTDALIKEIQIQSKLHWGQHKIKTIYFGGGTPSMLPIDFLERVIEAIRTNFDTTSVEECSIEINPGTVTLDDLRAYRRIGIDRASFGVQAFQDRVLKSADRIHNASQAMKAIELAKEAGFTNISLDLMFGIPGQTRNDWQHSIQRAIELDVQHISLYNLTYEKGTPFYLQRQKGDITPVKEETEEWFYQYAIEQMEANLFQQYEISNFCITGFACKHNIGYWNFKQYLGIGPSAHSFDGKQRFWNVNHLLSYLKKLDRRELAIEKKEILDESMHLEEWIFLQLRQVKGFHFDDLKFRFGISIVDWPKSLEQKFGTDWQKWIWINEISLCLTKEGMRVSESIYPVFVEWFEGF